METPTVGSVGVGTENSALCRQLDGFAKCLDDVYVPEGLRDVEGNSFKGGGRPPWWIESNQVSVFGGIGVVLRDSLFDRRFFFER